MKRANLLDLVWLSTALVAAGCGEEAVPSGAMASATAGDEEMGSAGSDGMASTVAPSPMTATPATPNTSAAPVNPVAPNPATVGTPGVSPVPTGMPNNTAPVVNTGGTGGTPVVPGGGTGPVVAGGSGGMSAIDDCEVVVNFDEPWGVVATGGGTNPMEWETTVVPTVANGVFSVEVPFESSAQQFGWNGDYPDGPVDCTGRELVARVRLLSGFVEDPEGAPGGLLMYLFSNEWASSMVAWNNVPVPGEDWFEVSVGCAASAESEFDPATVNGLGFTFNSGGEDASSYAASSAAFEVDRLCWRTPSEPMGAGGAAGAGGEATGGGGASAGSGGTAPEGGADAGAEIGGAGGEPAGGAGGAPAGGTGGVPAAGAGGEAAGGAGGASAGAGGTAGGNGGASGGSAGGAGSDDCEMLINFSSPWGVVASGGGTDPTEWETEVDPTFTAGVFNVLVPFETAVQQFGWVGDYPSGPVDCTGWELVAKVRLLSGFVENPQSLAGGVQVYLFSDSWGAGLNAWNVVPAPSDDWFEATVTCDTAQGSDFDPTDVNGIGFTFNSGGDNPTDYDADPAEFEVDHLCWRK